MRASTPITRPIIREAANVGRASSRRRGGFTLIEMMVVLAIVAIVTAITVGGFQEMREGNKRVSCQTNLVQIYQASRLYAADEGGYFPSYTFDTENNCSTTPHGIGLWSLYTFPQSGGDKVGLPYSTTANDDTEVKPVERYLRSAKVLHCPSDFANGSLLNLTDPANPIYNNEYLSYQSCDGGNTDLPTYATERIYDSSVGSWSRQLIHKKGTSPPYDFVKRPPTSNTVVSWCWHHRNSRGFDNVLFYDGSVQLLPNDGSNNWLRTPKPPQ